MPDASTSCPGPGQGLPPPHCAIDDVELLARAGLVLWRWDLAEGTVYRWGDVEGLFGPGAAELLTDVASPLDGLDPQGAERVCGDVRDQLLASDVFDVAFRAPVASGPASERWLRASGHAIARDGPVPTMAHGVLAPMPAPLDTPPLAPCQTSRDPLTGLLNRAAVFEHMTAALADERPGGRLAVLLVDVDRLKVVNDHYGHRVGDRMLVEVALRLAGACPEADAVARLGGDEFLVVSRGVDRPVVAEQMAQRIQRALRTPLFVDQSELGLSVSVGIAIAERSGDDVDRLLLHADVALRAAKDDGRGQAARFDSRMRRQHDEQHLIERELREALATGALDVHVQPEVALGTGALVGVEALARWTSPTMGPVPAERFIAAAEDTGLIGAIGRSVMRKACEAAAGWLREDPEALGWVAVNLSPRELLSPSLPDDIAFIIAESGLHPARLCVEITERMLIADADTAASVLRDIKALGVTIALDDFGTGHSSLALLKTFPVDFLKIDRSFVDGLGAEAEDTAIVTAVIGMAHAMCMPVIAEGVETLEQEEHLRELGCDFAQGWRYARPTPLGPRPPPIDAAGAAAVTPRRRSAPSSR